jgi:hypothetical protein
VTIGGGRRDLLQLLGLPASFTRPFFAHRADDFEVTLEKRDTRYYQWWNPANNTNTTNTTNVSSNSQNDREVTYELEYQFLPSIWNSLILSIAIQALTGHVTGCAVGLHSVCFGVVQPGDFLNPTNPIAIKLGTFVPDKDEKRYNFMCTRCAKVLTNYVVNGILEDERDKKSVQRFQSGDIRLLFVKDISLRKSKSSRIQRITPEPAWARHLQKIVEEEQYSVLCTFQTQTGISLASRNEFLVPSMLGVLTMQNVVVDVALLLPEIFNGEQFKWDEINNMMVSLFERKETANAVLVYPFLVFYRILQVTLHDDSFLNLTIYNGNKTEHTFKLFDTIFYKAVYNLFEALKKQETSLLSREQLKDELFQWQRNIHVYVGKEYEYARANNKMLIKFKQLIDVVASKHLLNHQILMEMTKVQSNKTWARSLWGRQKPIRKSETLRRRKGFDVKT